MAGKVRQAAVALKSLENQLLDTSITSPMDGTVLNRYVEKGAYVQPGTPLFQVVGRSTLKVETEVDGLRP
ncbi:hypothetical protein SY88_02770 [Clostridiales bacterium PH28_bin88]|nr:hypothetical protein SY88_02770 [Clostridiales bacterium PH28_bin88]